MRHALALLLAALLAVNVPALTAPGTSTTIPPGRVFVHDTTGLLPSVPPEYGPFDVRITHTGFAGPEPSTGVTNDGSIFFQALQRTLRSRDQGQTFQDITPGYASATTFDPMLWVDQATNRVYADQLGLGQSLYCSYAVWSDTNGDQWDGVNPFFCSLVPPGNNDHQKLSTGPIPSGLAPLPGLPPLPVGTRATYYTWNDGAATHIALSLDGGVTFPLARVAAQGTCNGGLEGRTRSFPDGSLIVPKRDCGAPVAAVSSDFNTWEQVHVAGAGVTDHRKNPDVAIDDSGNAYFFWSGGDNGTWMAHSSDKGHTWSAPVRASPPNVLSTTMQSSVAGSAGKVAVLYYGTADSALAPDHVPTTAVWHAYLAFSMNALSADPVWVTLQLDDSTDPIQVGCISTNTDGHCSHRNLLDFTDLVADAHGGVIGAYADGCRPGCTYASSTGNEGVSAVVLSGATLR
jgi:hypothetical protein